MSIFKFPGPVIANMDPRFLTTNTTAFTSGTLVLTSIDLPLGFPVTTIYWFPGTTSLVLGTSPHYWVALFDSSTRALLRQSTDDSAAVITASTLKTSTLSSSYTTTTAGQFLIGICISQTGGTLPTMCTYAGLSAVNNITMVGGQKFNGTSTASLTDTAPNPAAAITGVGATPYVGVA